MTKEFDVRSADFEALLAEYGDAAVVHRRASEGGKAEVANRAYARLSAVANELRSRGPGGRDAFLRLLSDPRAGVRVWAATHSLSLAPEQATAVLEEIASGSSSLVEFSAKMVLQQWRAGTFRAP